MQDLTRARLVALGGRAALSEFAAVDIVRRHRLPEMYCEVLQIFDGAEGFVGASYIRLYGSSDLAKHARTPTFDHLEGLSVFATNGAGEAFGFDRDGAVVMIPWIGGVDDAVLQGSFDDFMRRLHDGRLFDRASAKGEKRQLGRP